MGFSRSKLVCGLLGLAMLGVSASSHATGSKADDDGERAPADAKADDQPAANGFTRTFPYRQKRYLYSRNRAGGLAYVTRGAAAGAKLPVVVFLHGMNADGHVHPWFGSAYGDLRQIAEQLVSTGKTSPFVLAAPTHTRFATGATVMWPGFDLADFIDATQAALGETATLDRARVIVVGHSAAGCNPQGGILSEGLARAHPTAVIAVDTCLDDKVESGLRELATKTQLRLYWQRSWARPFAELDASCTACQVHELTGLTGLPHQAVLPEALSRALPELLPPGAPTAQTPHD